MKAVIVPGKYNDDLKLLTDLTPEYILPIVNKPIVEHIIEHLVCHGIKEIIIVLQHMPYETEQYFEKGTRWGVDISFSLEQEGKVLKDFLKHIRAKLNEPFLCLYGNCLTNIDLTSFIKYSNDNNSYLTVAKLPGENNDIDEFAPFIMTIEMLQYFLDNNLNKDIINLMQTKHELKTAIYETQSDFSSISSLNDYWEINKSIMNEKFNGILVNEKLQEPGLWVGRHTKIDKKCRLKPPVIIGDYCNITGDVFIGKDTIIGNNVVIDKNSSIENSIIFKNSYIGSETEIIDSAVVNKRLINIPRKVSAYVTDDFIIGDLSKELLASKSQHLVNVLTSLLIIVIFSPLLLIMTLYHFINPSKKRLKKERRLGNNEITDLKSTIKAKLFTFYSFQSPINLIKKFPGLWNVIKGDIFLVGSSPLTEAEANELNNELKSLRVNAPVGLFHLWEIESKNVPALEERIVMENYYNVTRTLGGDMKIVLKSIFKGSII